MFGLLSGLWDSTLPTPYNLLILGLDSSGKSTLLSSLLSTPSLTSKDQKLPPLPPNKIKPTTGVNRANIEVNNTPVTIYDPSGKPGARRLWSYYYPDCEVRRERGDLYKRKKTRKEGNTKLTS
jgi:ADP-ribosylation factor related protein 1